MTRLLCYEAESFDKRDLFGRGPHRSTEVNSPWVRHDQFSRRCRSGRTVAVGGRVVEEVTDEEVLHAALSVGSIGHRFA